MTSRPCVVHVSSVHPCSDNRVHLREAASLASAGYPTHLVAIDQDVPIPDTGVTVIRLRRRTRFARMFAGSFGAIWMALRTGAKIFHLHDPELVWAVLPLRLLGRKVIFDAHEDVPNQILVKHYLPPWIRRPLSYLSHVYIWLAGRSNHVIAATDTIATRFPAGKTSVVRNFPRLREFDDSLPPLARRSSKLAYAGALTVERGAEVMVDSVGNAACPSEWRLVLAGAVSPETLLNELSERRGWSNVEYLGVVSPTEARNILSDCRLGLILLQRNQSYLDSLPTKMFEFFAAGMPVIASDFPLWRHFVIDNDCGTLVDETSPAATAHAIARYTDDPDLLERHGRNARRAALELFNWSSEETTLLGVYATLAR